MTLIFILHKRLGECVYKQNKIHVQNIHGTMQESTAWINVTPRLFQYN